MQETKAQMRREKMQVFNGQVQEERVRLAMLNLGAQELVELFDCGCFFTELAASGLLLEQGKAVGMDACCKVWSIPSGKCAAPARTSWIIGEISAALHP